MADSQTTPRNILLLLLFVLASLLFPGCSTSHHNDPATKLATATTTAAQTPPPNETMAQILQDVNAHTDPTTIYFMNTERAQKLGGQIAQTAMSPQLAELELQYADELLNAGQSQQALNEYELVRKQVQQNAPDAWQQVADRVLMQEATAYLRLGEQQNCCDNDNADSCLVPITGMGVHTRPAGSLGAVKCLTEILKKNSSDLKARWLLNIAYMTLGEYPQDVPAKWVIPLKDYGGDYPMRKFYNAAPQMHLDMLGWAGGAIVEDFEGNGLLDIMVSSMRPNAQLRYFHNNGDGTFTERTKEAGLLGEVGGLNMIVTDYNNDGRPDVVILRGGWQRATGANLPLSLLRNDGHGHFTDVTLQAGLYTTGPTQTAVAFDYNGDGYLDLFVGYESSPEYDCHCKLFRNNGNGTFTDVTQQCGINIDRFVKGVVSADYDHSGRPSLYLSCFKGKNILLHNDGPAGADKSPTAPWKFTDVTAKAGADHQDSSFSCFFFDYDNDGWPDIFVCGYDLADVSKVAADYLGVPTDAAKACLYHNNHDGTFTDVTKQAHLDKVIEGMGINYGDLDNDGWPDFYVGTGTPDLTGLMPKRMFRNHDGKYFDEVTTTGDFGHLQKGHGIAFGDINNNGQQDIFEVMGGAYSGDTAHDCLYVNPGSPNHWINLKLEGVRSNRIAIGAEICVTVVIPQGSRNIYDTVGPGGSFGCNPLRQGIGLGNATSIKQVTIHWPASGITQTLTNLKMDNFYKVKEGDSTAQLLHMKTFKLPTRSTMSMPMMAMSH